MSVSVVQFDGFEMKVIAFQELFLLLGPLKRTTPLQPLTKYKPREKSEMVKIILDLIIIENYRQP